MYMLKQAVVNVNYNYSLTLQYIKSFIHRR